ncbi:MAG: hypothetical protein HZA81_01650 [Candidatus Taylorbacteria bacterium]|nr:hypothetical protein [Candidatus Taylorbacteria bacterium]
MTDKRKQPRTKVRWFLCALTNAAHHNLGQSLGSSGVSDETRLNEKMKTADGEYDLWDCEGMTSSDVKRLAIDFLKSDQPVRIYRKHGDNLPKRWADSDVTEAERGSLDRQKEKGRPKEPSPESPAALAKARLDELLAKRGGSKKAS